MGKPIEFRFHVSYRWQAQLIEIRFKGWNHFYAQHDASVTHFLGLEFLFEEIEDAVRQEIDEQANKS